MQPSVYQLVSYPGDGTIGDWVDPIGAFVDGLGELAHAFALAEVEAGAGGRPRGRLLARLPVAALEPRLVLEATVIAAPVDDKTVEN